MKKTILILMFLIVHIAAAQCPETVQLEKDSPVQHSNMTLEFVSATHDSCDIDVDSEKYSVQGKKDIGDYTFEFVKNEDAKKDEVGKYIVHMSIYEIVGDSYLFAKTTHTVYGNEVEYVEIDNNACTVNVNGKRRSFIEGSHAFYDNALMIMETIDNCKLHIFEIGDSYEGSLDHIPGYESQLLDFAGKQIEIYGVSTDKKRISVSVDGNLMWLNRYELSKVNDLYMRVSSVEEGVQETLTSCSLKISCPQTDSEKTDETAECGCDDGNDCTNDLCTDAGCRYEKIEGCNEVKNIFQKFMDWVRNFFS